MKIFPKEYKCLKQQNFKLEEFQIIPIRYEDRYKIMNWRNDQIYHLRQDIILTKKDQDKYFLKVVSKLFSENYPKQILFSYLRKNKLIGYGGIVNIDWNKKTAEISFVMDTSLEERKFEFHWKSYLSLIEQVAFGDINLESIFTYAYDLRPRLYSALEDSGFIKNKVLKNSNDFDVIIHSKNNTNVK